MNYCINHFKDIELRGIIFSNALIKECDLCHKTDGLTIDTKSLYELFEPLFRLYLPDDKSKDSIFSIIEEDWSIFDNKDSCELIINEILRDTELAYLLSKKVKRINVDSTSKQIEIWKDFVSEIKSKNRFFIDNDIIGEETLKDILSFYNNKIKAGQIFYRSRVCDTYKGYRKAMMGAPPNYLASAGRANPQGISYFYLSKEEDTTLYETRSTYLDYVCVAEFKLKEDINIINLHNISVVSPFSDGLDLSAYLANKDLVIEFEKALSTPLRRFDSELDYLPTQYLCEYIKSIGFDGIEYSSAMKSGGTNYAIFYQDKFQFESKKVIEVKSVKIGSVEIDSL
ncbi:RES family NAD+ phosphorylase [uncultured Bacteroides sp.]|uniref:RES family NAD+ phosphorylase n=1 Tax=uncultured Bacteroides sp. TaxID=162156 RepID=UPI002AAC2850|nr:RES family NAD+ phosphorylase [uncultured Bacteroides sp.]